MLRFNVPVVSVLIPVSATLIIAVNGGVRVRVRIVAIRVAEAFALLIHDIAVIVGLRTAEARRGVLALARVEGPSASFTNRLRSGKCIYCVVLCWVELLAYIWYQLELK